MIDAVRRRPCRARRSSFSDGATTTLGAMALTVQEQAVMDVEPVW
ncbi:hypothetical protein M878_25640 [Streptomyces roseochromogenus subsp. oscitans DS 12.976]|uniref:Uncharacterized protein n=1 Tax=Streptomyces roseochromogenus subsp. oscitans DS 12.976 TaxID=1352936 RepID=V6KEH2_STRRC|nr:hypothetical protein M878_25640 [Streptomyces roseochromogenus subsp. oscitans DS 12.976]